MSFPTTAHEVSSKSVELLNMYDPDTLEYMPDEYIRRAAVFHNLDSENLIFRRCLERGNPSVAVRNVPNNTIRILVSI